MPVVAGVTEQHRRTSGASAAARARAIRRSVDALAPGLDIVDRSSQFGGLVSAKDLRSKPIHRWYYYKEGFSPSLPVEVLSIMGVGNSRTIVDVFGGVGTTALALSREAEVDKVISVEYSPFASFAAQVKLSAQQLDPKILGKHVARLASADDCPKYEIPDLSSFRDPRIFHEDTLRDLLRIVTVVNNDVELTDAERNFFLLGIAAITEDVSGAMKDGRALRIRRGRQRWRQGLTPSMGGREGYSVVDVALNQWLAMIEDVEGIDVRFPAASISAIRGDACRIDELRDCLGRRIFTDDSVAGFIFSPPYLNCIDYSEVYKLELWLLGFIVNHQQFRELREGTLRSHPSIDFPPRVYKHDRSAEVFHVVDAMSDFLRSNASRPKIGDVHADYFADMHEVLSRQYDCLEPGGYFACVVGNSTFSRRSNTADGARIEHWRLAVPTDVILGRIAESIGFEGVEIWLARRLQAKNVSGEFPRESIVIGRKPRPLTA